MTPTDYPSVHDYLTGARWFGGKGRDVDVVEVHRAGVLRPDDGAESPWPVVAVELVTVTYAAGASGPSTADERETYQLPVAYYPEAQERLEHALVGTFEDVDLGGDETEGSGVTLYGYDAAHDRDAAALWLAAFDRAAEAPVTAGDLTFARLPGHDLDPDAQSALFSGEQSNSSLRFGEDALMKLFRKVTPGRNPDIVIHRALTERGSDHVAALYGWLELSAGDDAEPTQLAMLQQFLRTASDGWGLALASVRDLYAEADLRADEVGGDFAGEAERLGQATAEVHDLLADQFSTEAWGSDELRALSASMIARLDAAVTVVPELEALAPGLRATFEQVAGLASAGESATAQRVHGDFHLGQTLRTVRGWKIVDFEGEPAKPLAERVLPDLVWRDVAGMLRSFDYAAHAVVADFQADAEANRQIAFRAAEWAARNQDAFVRGYTEHSVRTGGDTLSTAQDVVMRAYVADKAVYEAVYEARNRPTWLPIPLAAIGRLTQHLALDFRPKGTTT